MQGLPAIGDVLDDTYRIEKQIGTGGFGAVYLARQLSMDREVALKILVANAMNVDEMIQRFRREVMACRNLGHPNTIRIYDFRDRPDGILYYTMEYVNGPTLKDVIKNDGPIAPARVAHILRQICKSLAEAHSFGIVHRDLKPANIMLANIAGETDFVKVVDFGIAKIVDGDDGEDRDQLTNAGVLVGTLNYMSPEQIQGGEIGPVSDLYALGLIAIEMLIGRSVFEGTGRWEILHKQISDEPVDIPQQVLDSVLGPVLKKALEKRPTERYPKAEAMLRALNDLSGLSDQPITERETPAPEPAKSVKPSDMSLPTAVPVESEPPLPEPVRAPEPAAKKGAAAANSEGSLDGFSELPTSLHDSGVNPNPLVQQAAREPMHSPVPATQTAGREPMHSPVPPQHGFVPSGDTDVGPAPAKKGGIIAIVGVLAVLLVGGGIAAVSFGGSAETTEPVDKPAVELPAQPTEVAVNTPPAEIETTPIEDDRPAPPSDPAVPSKMIRLLTPGVKAQLFEGEELVGFTPLNFPVAAKKTFTVRAEGYEEQQVVLSGESEDVVDVKLQKIGGAAVEPTKRPTTTTTTTTTKTNTVKPPKDKKPSTDDWVDVKKKKTDVPVF